MNSIVQAAIKIYIKYKGKLKRHFKNILMK